MRKRLFIYFNRIESPLIITFVSEALADHAFNDITRKVGTSAKWSNANHFVNPAEIRAVHLSI